MLDTAIGILTITPDMGLVLNDHVLCQILAFGTKHGIDLRPGVVEQCIDCRFHGELDIHKASEQFEILTFAVSWVYHSKVFL